MAIQKRGGTPAALARITKEQLALTGGTLVTSGLVDLCTHGNPAWVVGGLIVTGAIGYMSPDILGTILPPEQAKVYATAERTADVLTQGYPLYEDQSTRAKLTRMTFGKVNLTEKPLEDVYRKVIAQQSVQEEGRGDAQPKDVALSERDAWNEEEWEVKKPQTRRQQPVTVPPAFDFTSKDVLAAPIVPPSVPFTFSSVLETFKPRLSRIYLGTLPSGEFATLQARDLCHTAVAGSTRGGKSHLLRLLMSQLCVAGANVYLLNPHYTRYDLESRDPYGKPCPEDWTPFEQWLKNDPRELIPQARKYKVIEHYLKRAFEMVGDRLEIYGRSEQVLGAPQFIVIDELPAIVDEVPLTAQYLKRILREGAKVGVFLINASHDFQVATTFKDVGGGVRKCYRTAYDVGTDSATQEALGLLKEKGLGKGRSSIRCDDHTSLLYVPYVDNESLYTLLGPSTYQGYGGRGVQQEERLVPPSAPEMLQEENQDIPQLDEYVARWYTGYGNIRAAAQYFGISPEASAALYDQACQAQLITPPVSYVRPRRRVHLSPAERDVHQRRARASAHALSMRPPVERAHTAHGARTEEERTCAERIDEVMRPPVERAHTAHGEMPRLSNLQIKLFLVAYEETGNRDESLRMAGANTRYRDHAREILREHGLSK